MTSKMRSEGHFRIKISRRIPGRWIPPDRGSFLDLLRHLPGGSFLPLGSRQSTYPGFYGDFFQFRTPRALILGVENDVEGSSFMVVAVSQVGIACWCEPLQNEAERVLSRKSLELSVARSQPFKTVNRNRGRASEFVGTNVRTEVERFMFHKVAKHIQRNRDRSRRLTLRLDRDEPRGCQ